MPVKPLRVGLLIDCYELPEWVAENVQFFLDHPHIEVALVVTNAAYPLAKPGFNSPLDRLINNRALFYRFDAQDLHRAESLGLHEKELDMTDALGGVPTINAMPKMKKFSDRFSKKTIEEIKSHDLDFVFRFGFRIIRGGILDCSKYGVFSFHHDDNDEYRGGPPGFWEVYDNTPVSGVTLQVLTDKLDGGKVVSKTYRRTHPTSPRINQLRLTRSGNLLVRQLCEYLIHRRPTVDEFSERCTPGKPYNKRIYVKPTNFEMLIFTVKIAVRSFWARLRVGNNIPYWSVGVAKVNRSDNCTPTKKIKSAKPNWYTPAKSNSFVADPFGIQQDGQLFVFVEELDFSDWKGRISVMTYDDATGFSEPKTVLETDFHLSFPFIFEDDGNLLMVPEQASSNKVTLYRCDAFPNKWSVDRVLIDDFAGVDTVAYYDGQLWWLFTSDAYNNNGDSNLCLYYSDSLSGTFQPHPENPVRSGLDGSRMAGPIIEQNGKRLRAGQNCEVRYGESIAMFEIEELSTDSYRESRVDELRLSKNSEYQDCSHTLHVLEDYVITDGMKIGRS